MKIYWFKPPKKKKSLKRRTHELKNQDAKLGSNPRMQFGLQVSPNWFLQIWTMDPPYLEWALVCGKQEIFAIGLLFPEKHYLA
jgi:hypothetical protein